MRFRNKILVIFIASVLLSVITAIPFIFKTISIDSRSLENKNIESAFKKSLRIFRDNSIKEKEKLDKIINQVLIINREYTQSKVFKDDTLVDVLSILIVFFIIQGSLLILLFYITSRAVTSQFRVILSSIEKIKSDSAKFRIPDLSGYEFKMLGREFNKMLDVIESREKLIAEQAGLLGWREVASFLSHQLKNPLTSIELAGTNIELIYKEPLKGKLLLSNLLIIKEETKRLSGFVERFKEITNFPELKLKPVNLKKIITNVVSRYSNDNISFNINLKVSEEYLFDSQFIEQMFINLFNNSIDACREYRIPAEINVEAVERKGILEIRVSDSLSGLPEDLPEKVMLPRYSTKKNGTGLGLPFVKRIVSLHQGTIEPALSAKRGLLFIIRFPQKREI
ncbi:MAG: GHKL domain-containing protein [Spirochaetes bacterium]|nr:GHKL domain-containing protein [Spirochaetota bacterium]